MELHVSGTVFEILEHPSAPQKTGLYDKEVAELKSTLLKTEESLATATEAADGSKERETSLRTRADRLQDELSGLRRDSDRETARLKVRMNIRLQNTVETQD